MKYISTLLTTIILILIVLLFYIYFYYTYDTSSYRKKLSFIKDKNCPNKKILIVTLETRRSDMLNMHNENVRNYCKDKGYKYIFLDKYENELELPVYWKKIQLINDLLNEYEDYEYIMWMDSDTLFLDTDMKIDNILSNKSIYIGIDYMSNNNLNAGVFIIKNDIYGKDFIEQCIKTYINRDKCKDKTGKYTLNSGWSGDCYEQGIMNELLKTKYKQHTKILDPYIIRNHHTPVSNVFILHLWGGKNKCLNIREYSLKNLLKNKDYYDSRIEQLLFLLYKYII